MKERPILFSGSMVREILEGRKTQTRRVVKPQGLVNDDGGICSNAIPDSVWKRANRELPESWGLSYCCPYGQSGDRLWVRETWVIPKSNLAEVTQPLYRADAIRDDSGEREGWWFGKNDFCLDSTIGKWRPSIHMPRWASRITLEITGVRVERLQKITDTDALSEGMNKITPRGEFRWLWDSIYGANGIDGGGPKAWGSNPWVWVIEFKRI